MRVIALSYASSSFVGLQRIWALTARRAGFDDIRPLGPDALSPEFRAAHTEILSEPKGAGQWLWKPYLLDRALAEIDPGDVVVYNDAGTHFVRSIDPIVSLMDQVGLDLLLFGEGFVEGCFTKRDAFILMGCDEQRYSGTPQRFASVFAVRKTESTRRMMTDWLTYAEDPRILTDMPNTLGEPDHPGFVAHRHDQSILSLLSKRHGVPVPPNRLVSEGLAPPGHQVLNHTRRLHPPSQILHHLLGHGVLAVGDLDGLAADPHLE